MSLTIVARARKERAQEALEFLFSIGAVDRSRAIGRDKETVNIPLRRTLKADEFVAVADRGCKIRILQRAPPGVTRRKGARVPFDEIARRLSGKIQGRLVKELPDKWEIYGNLATVKLPSALKKHEKTIGAAYARALGVGTVLADAGGISGEYRTPKIRVIYGNKTETVHIENKVKFKFDAAKIMYSSGNMEERKRMSRICRPHETVADLFAGIGYFSIPMAVYSRPARIFACEINPVSHGYLRENVRLNNVQGIVTSVLGDCRKVAPKGAADRVIMGYLGTFRYLDAGLSALKERGGTIHYHDACAIDKYSAMEKRLRAKCASRGRSVESLKLRTVKSYAPCINHIVADMELCG